MSPVARCAWIGLVAVIVAPVLTPPFTWCDSPRLSVTVTGAAGPAPSTSKVTAVLSASAMMKSPAYSNIEAAATSCPTGAMKLVPWSIVACTSTPQASTEPGVVAQAARVTTTALLAATRSRAS